MFPPGFNPAEMLKGAASGQAETVKKAEELVIVAREIRELLEKILKALNGEETNA